MLEGVVHGVDVEEMGVGWVGEDEQRPVHGYAQEDVYGLGFVGFELADKLLEVF